MSEQPLSSDQKLFQVIQSPLETRRAIGEVTEGRMSRYDEQLSKMYMQHCESVERTQGGQRMRVVDRSADAFQRELSEFQLAVGQNGVDAHTSRVVLGGLSFDAENILTGLWTSGITGQQYGHAVRDPSSDIGIPYLHRARQGGQETVSTLVLSRNNARRLASAIEGAIFAPIKK